MKSPQEITFSIVANNSLITSKVGMSGGDNIFVELARRLSRRGLKVYIFSGRNVQGYFKKLKLKNVEFVLYSQHRLSVYKQLFINSLKKLVFGIKVALTYRLPKNSVNYIYSASDFWPDVIPALLMKILNQQAHWGASFYQKVRAPWYTDSPYKGKRFFWGLLYWLQQLPIYWLIRLFADHIFVTSTPDTKLFPSKPVFVVRGGVNIEPSERYYQVGKFEPKIYDAVFIGRLHPQKGIEELVDIWKIVLQENPKSKLIIIGNGPLEKELRTKIAKLNLAKNVKLVGYQTGEIKYDLFKKSKIVVHPAVYDSGGMAAAEAMAWGLPGVAFDLESLKTYYPQGIIKVPKGELNSFAKSICLLLKDQKTYDKYAKEARDLIRNQWSWDKRIDEMFSFICSISHN